MCSREILPISINIIGTDKLYLCLYNNDVIVNYVYEFTHNVKLIGMSECTIDSIVYLKYFIE